ncbi:MAG: fucose isomerase [Candidatus Lokiarchaeota archaeon]|nr:fucose isomerase [Candidatus Lokiarchaeota archaeon]
MSFIEHKVTKSSFGVIVSNRDVFPDHLVEEGREDIIQVLNELEFEHIILNKEDTPFGAVETYQDAKVCANLFKKNREKIDGILIILSNFGDEKGIADTIKLSGLDVPVLVQASSDAKDKMGRANRRDAFCGKISICGVLNQYGIPYTLTQKHTCSIDSNIFKNELRKFDKICRVIKSVKNARFGQVGTRPNAFDTVRYSEKLLQHYGITVEPIDLSEIFGAINRLESNDPRIAEKIKFIKSYTSTNVFPEEGLTKLAKLAVVVEEWLEEKELDGFAFQCWPSIQDNFGIVPCAVMSIFSEGLIPAACEVDIPGLVGMYILQSASGTPSAILDWNNNYGDDLNKMVLFHCSNLPKSFFIDTQMTIHPIISDQKGGDVTFGAIQGRIKPSACTLLRIDTDDVNGQIKALLVEGEYTEDELDSYGGYGVIKIPSLQPLLKKVCKMGFAHHVAATLNNVAEIVDEALSNYLGWNIEYHNKKY